MPLLDHPIISQRYFFPRSSRLKDPTWVDVDGARLACHYSQGDHPIVVVHFHGNGEVCADYVPEFPARCAAMGADCFLAEYRGYGGSTGTPQLGAMLDDIEPIYEAIGRPASEIVVFGRSVGSIYAIEFASQYPVAGLILESGIADPEERILLRASPSELGTTPELLRAEFRARLDHEHKLVERTRPTLVMHARGDSLVKATHGVRLASYPRSNVRLVLFDEGNHNTIFGRNETRYMEEFAELVELARDGGAYPATTRDNDTLEGGVAVFEDTHEFSAPKISPRRGPGDTAPIEVPDLLRDRLGPGDTLETNEYSDDNDDDEG